ncbi:unnamed protein product [Caenorhabditis auriculariae]|uniref:Serine/threonine specific protein phosphatases domain-containing protein n=1 Tax=Caenorhabditis auriculariae TaxID=2777116 RepID=A0A8S1HDR9_9PELO|nr:unnamed protein product [Caenorhabditis auriculariae]
MALFFLLAFAFHWSSSQAYSQQKVITELTCATGNVDGKFIETRKDQITTKYACVYKQSMTGALKGKKRDIPSWRMHYDMVPLAELPPECQHENHFFPFLSDRSSLYCCHENYCNFISDPLEFLIRHENVAISFHSYSYYVAVMAIAITIYPIFMLLFEKRERDAWKSAELDHVLNLSEFPENHITFKEHPIQYAVSPRFDSVKNFNRALRNLIKPELYENEDSSRPESDLCVMESINAFQQDDIVCKKVFRSDGSKFIDLARRLIEQGPYEFDFDPVEVGELFDIARDVLMDEPPLLEISNDVYIYGSVQGNYADLLRFFQLNGYPPESKMLFLGGYTSEGAPHSLETIVLLVALKLMLPSHVYLLRGATEVHPVNIGERFQLRVRRYLCQVIDETCAALPYAAIVGERILCTHGGIPSKPVSLAKLRSLSRSLEPIVRGSLQAELIFGVPSRNCSGPIPGIRGRHFNLNSERDFSVLESISCDFFICGRNPLPKGFYFFGTRAMALWSAITVNKYAEEDGAQKTIWDDYTSAACLHVHENLNIHIIRLVKYIKGKSKQLPLVHPSMIACRKRRRAVTSERPRRKASRSEKIVNFPSSKVPLGVDSLLIGIIFLTVVFASPEAPVVGFVRRLKPSEALNGVINRRNLELDFGYKINSSVVDGKMSKGEVERKLNEVVAVLESIATP